MRFYQYLVLPWISYFIAILIGCNVVNEKQNINLTLQEAEKLGFIIKEIQTKPFLLTSLQKITESHLPIVFYIEGDGRAWISSTQISLNPTPIHPLALKLALLDNSANIVYLGRPCQYTDLNKDKACYPAVWTDERFSIKVINAMNEAIDNIKNQNNTKANKIHLVGFSGGGGLSVLMAAHRNAHDIASIRTVAGDLDTQAMTNYHQTTPFINSLNPKDYAGEIFNIPQVHYVGDKDTVVPLHIAKGFLASMHNVELKDKTKNKDNTNNKIKDTMQNRQSADFSPNLLIMKNMGHHGWEKYWPTLLNEYQNKL